MAILGGVELESYKKNVTAVADYLREAMRELSRPQNVLAPQPHKMPPPPSLPKPAQAMTRRRQKKG
jgi:hypothetical protein